MAPKNQPTPEWTPDVGIDPVEMQRGVPLPPTPGLIPKKPKLVPVDRRSKDIAVQQDWFVRQNLVSNDESYTVPQYIMGVDPNTGQSAIVENPEYDPKLDPNGTLKVLPISKGPKVGMNGELLPSRYPIKGKALMEKGEYTNTLIRQDN